MRHDDFSKKITQRLDHLARQHQNQPKVMNHVLEHVQQRTTTHYGWWKMSGFALAAALAGVLIFPNTETLNEAPITQTQNVTKLSPQLVEDLEMLRVLGEDHGQHGS